MITIRLDLRFDIGGVGRCDRWFSHQKRRADFPIEQRLQPLLLLRWRAVFHQHFHIASVGRSAVENFRRNVATPGQLGDWRVISIGKARAKSRIGVEHVPQACRLRLVFQLVNDRRDFPTPFARPELRMLTFIGLVALIDIFIHEFGNAFEIVLTAVGIGEMHEEAPFERFPEKRAPVFGQKVRTINICRHDSVRCGEGKP